jgi:tetratricopeptide (TPR) repeat protein
MGGKLLSAKVIIALLVVVLSACGGKEERETRYLERGRELFAKGDFVKAQLEFRNALQINPKGIDAQYHLGLISEREANWPEAFARFSRVVEENPDHAQAQLKLAQLHLIGGELEQTEAKLRELERLMPQTGDLYALRASLAMRRGKSQEAQLLAEGALGKEPEHVGAALVLANALAGQGNLDGALRSLDAALDKNPNEVALHLLKVQLNLGGKRTADAVTAYRALVSAQPKSYEHRLNLARLLVAQGEVGEAEAVLREAARAGVGGIEAKLAVVDLIARRVGFAEAEAEAKALAAAAPEEHAYAFKLANLYVSHDRRGDAEVVLRAIVEKDGDGPNGVEALVGLARLAATNGERGEATAFLDEAFKIDAENAGALLVRGTLALQADELDGALADARTVLRTQPRSAEALRLLAQTQLRRKEPHLAMETLAQLVDVEPANAVAREQLARLHLARNEPDQALAQYDAVLSATPDRVESLLPRVEILIAKKQFVEAQAAIARISAMPDRAAAGHMLTGRLELAQGKLEPAVAAFRKAQALTPDAEEPVTAVVQAYFAANRPNDALAYLDEVGTGRPNDAFLLNLKGEALADSKRIAEAVEAFRRALAARPDWEVPYANLGNVLVGAGQAEEGLAAFRDGLARLPESARLLYSFASAQERVGDPLGAIATYEKILAKDPASAVAANNYAALVADFAFEDAAALNRAVELVERFQTSSDPFFLDTLGWLQYRRGDYAQARIYLDRAARLKSDMPIIHYHLGMALYRLGDKEAARAALQSAVADGASYPGRDEAKATLAALSQS